MPQEGYGHPYIEQGGLLMPTEREKQAEKERVTKISGFRVGYHDLLAEIDLPALKARNDRWEAEHQHMTREERKQDELYRMVAYIGGGKAAGHIAIHIHAAHACGATKEEIYQLIKKVAPWASGPESYQTALEAWRLVFMPDFPTVFRIVELTEDSFPAA